MEKLTEDTTGLFRRLLQSSTRLSGSHRRSWSDGPTSPAMKPDLHTPLITFREKRKDSPLIPEPSTYRQGRNAKSRSPFKDSPLIPEPSTYRQGRNEKSRSPRRQSPGRSPRPWLISSASKHRAFSREEDALGVVPNMPVFYVPFAGAASEASSFPHEPDCGHCGAQLLSSEARWGTGLCDRCYNTSQRKCKVCKSRLPVNKLHLNTGICDACSQADMNCKFCKVDLQIEQLHWCTGLCDACYDSCEKTCRVCKGRLQNDRLSWGLCNACHSAHQAKCVVCEAQLADDQLNWGTGLCDSCYDGCEKTCHGCQDRINLGALHWRSWLCNTCYDKSEKVCTKCQCKLDLKEVHYGTGLCNGCYNICDKECKICKLDLDRSQLRWGTGLCDPCFDKCEKTCKMCQFKIPLGEVHWRTGLCDSCYCKTASTCKLCHAQLGADHHYGTGICDSCYDKCHKTCRSCRTALDFGELHWGTGLCDRCYMSAKGRNVKRGLKPSVKAAIMAQLVFYMAPAMMLPSLYVHVYRAEWSQGSPTTSYSVVLTTASVVSMMIPVPFGLWAERRGERDVYVSVTIVAAIASLALTFAWALAPFALAWALLSAPPALRGVRAAFFAKHVSPDELCRAGQLASSAGLLGGFLGPIMPSVFRIFIGPDGIFGDHMGPNGFTVCAVAANTLHVCCAMVLFSQMPTQDTYGRQATGKPHSGDQQVICDTCDMCSKKLSAEESKYQLALCNVCYDTYGGQDINFRRYQRRMLIGFCIIAGLLEFSENAGVLAPFQPIAVARFGWTSQEIANANIVGAGVSVIVSFTFAWLRLNERHQIAFASGLYLFSVLLFTLPVHSECLLVLGLLFGLKAQILFMAPFTSIFSCVIGRTRLTNRLTTFLCLAPLIGGAMGTMSAPLFISLDQTPWFTLAALPSCIAIMGIAYGWKHLERKQDVKPYTEQLNSDGSKADDFTSPGSKADDYTSP